MLSTTLGPTGNAGRLQTVIQQIRENIDGLPDRRALARLAGFSVPHLQRLFANEYGESLAGYLRRARLERAARKLRMGAVDITEVALAAGFKTHAAFSKAFKSQLGMSPSAFRGLGCAEATSLLNKGVLDENHGHKRINR